MAGFLNRLRGLFSGRGEGRIARRPKGGGESFEAIDRGNLGQILSLAIQEYEAGKSIMPQDLYPRSRSERARWSNFSSAAALDRYRAVSWVYVCCKKTSDAIGQLPWIVQQEQANGTWQDTTGTALGELMENPNAFQSRQTFTSRIVLELLLAGNSVVAKIRVNEVPVELFTVRPQQIAPVPSKEEFISGYVVKSEDGKSFKLAAEDVVHLQFPDPADPYWGLSPLRAAARIIDVESDAQSWQKSSLQNMMVPPGIMRYGQPISLDQFKREKEILSEEYQGALNARRPLLLGSQSGPGPDWQQLGLSPVDVDFINTRKLSREEICAIYGVPLPVAGILENATYNNISTAKSMWWDDSLIPMLALIEGAFNLQLAPEFGEGQRVRADSSKVFALLEQLEKRLSLVERAWKIGVPFNEGSEFFGLGLKVDGGDVGYIPANVLPSEATGIGDMPSQPEDLDVEGDEDKAGGALSDVLRARKSNGKPDRSEQLRAALAPLRAHFGDDKADWSDNAN